eukprot:TRINITY_DN4249_c0_g1_i1.p1 TRINITY_DN4249_c0_g1~~TRINITY_DN4249_c0_g1_i1.p1  ORF type:complete len:306 (+),score=67.21 TRINITY_DN4249_c0_g1_i1:61-918(+)
MDSNKSRNYTSSGYDSNNKVGYGNPERYTESHEQSSTEQFDNYSSNGDTGYNLPDNESKNYGYDSHGGSRNDKIYSLKKDEIVYSSSNVYDNVYSSISSYESNDSSHVSEPYTTPEAYKSNDNKYTGYVPPKEYNTKYNNLTNSPKVENIKPAYTGNSTKLYSIKDREVETQELESENFEYPSPYQVKSEEPTPPTKDPYDDIFGFKPANEVIGAKQPQRESFPFLQELPPLSSYKEKTNSNSNSINIIQPVREEKENQTYAETNNRLDYLEKKINGVKIAKRVK